MEFTIQREPFLRVLQPVVGVVERKHNQPILANLLLSVEQQKLTVTAADSEIELIGVLALEEESVSGDITVPAKKLFDICKGLPDRSSIRISFENQKVTVHSGRSRFSLSTLPAADFPCLEGLPSDIEFNLSQEDLRYLIERVHFAMASQDLRYYLNGMFLEQKDQLLRAVATDGHRLAIGRQPIEQELPPFGIILPRKGVVELLRLLDTPEASVTLSVSSRYFRVATDAFTFSTKLVEGKYPNFDRVVPKSGGAVVSVDSSAMKSILSRVSILCNEKIRGIHLSLEPGILRARASNAQQEEAEDYVEVDYQGKEMEISFNVRYLIDVLNTVGGEAQFTFTESSGLLIEGVPARDSLYVVMPMRV